EANAPTPQGGGQLGGQQPLGAARRGGIVAGQQKTRAGEQGQLDHGEIQLRGMAVQLAEQNEQMVLEQLDLWRMALPAGIADGEGMKAKGRQQRLLLLLRHIVEINPQVAGGILAPFPRQLGTAPPQAAVATNQNTVDAAHCQSSGCRLPADCSGSGRRWVARRPRPREKPRKMAVVYVAGLILPAPPLLSSRHGNLSGWRRCPRWVARFSPLGAGLGGGGRHTGPDGRPGLSPGGAGFPGIHPSGHRRGVRPRPHRAQDRQGLQGVQLFAGPEVSLEDDLIRRDLTINAMARAADGTLIDPHGGQRDLDARVLRHVSDAFAEDPLRVLRVARFAARYHHLGFTIAPETLALMGQLAASDELSHLTPERVWAETHKALGEASPWIYIEVLRQCGALAVLLPEVERLFGIPQRADYHPEVDTGIHTLMTLEQAARLSADPRVRFAALVHDLGKG